MRAQAEKRLSEWGEGGEEEEEEGVHFGTGEWKGTGSGRRRRIRTPNAYRKRKEEEEEEEKIGNKFTWQHFYGHASMLPDWLKGSETSYVVSSSSLCLGFLTDIVNLRTVQHEVLLKKIGAACNSFFCFFVGRWIPTWNPTRHAVFSCTAPTYSSVLSALQTQNIFISSAFWFVNLYSCFLSIKWHLCCMSHSRLVTVGMQCCASRRGAVACNIYDWQRGFADREKFSV